MRKFFTLKSLLLVCMLAFAGLRVSAQVNHIVISQVYGGGGNSGANFQNDYVELFNPTGASVAVNGWSLQYASAAGTTWSVALLSGTIQSGGYFLVKLASGGAVGAALPTPDVTPANAINMSGTSGKIALVSSTTAIASGTACPIGAATLVDFVGFGTTSVNCTEGTGTFANLSATTAAFRKSNGCTDTDVNSADFTVTTASPRNSATALNFCASTGTVTTTTASNITNTTASSGGNVTSAGSGTISARGVVWNTVTAPTVALSTKTNDGTATGVFTSGITSLTANTKYFYRAYVTTSVTTTYGTESNFTTISNAPGIGSGTSPTLNGFTANWSAPTGNGSEIFTYTLEVDDDINFGSINATQSNIASSTTAVSVSGLASSTTYYYRVKAVNTTGSSAYSATSAGIQTAAPATPVINITSSLAGFGSVCINNTTAANSFIIDGANLDGSNITLSALPGFFYSETLTGTYTNTLSFSYSGGGFTGKQIFVKFTPTLAQSYNGTITVSGGGIAGIPVFATATGINTPATVATGSNIVAGTSATLNGTISVIGCSSITAYGFEYSTTSGFVGGTGIQVTAANLGSGVFSKTVSGLTGATTYYYKAFATNGAGTAYGSESSFTTSSVVPVVMSVQPLIRYSENFNDIANWSANFTSGVGANHFSGVTVNATGTIPSATRVTTATTAFSSGTSGGVQKGTGNIQLLSTGSTDNSSSSAIDFYMDFTGMNAGTLSFDWASVNNSTGDRNGSLRVYASVDGINFIELTSADVLNFTNNVPSTGTVNSIPLPAIFNNSPTARLRFYYHNGTGGTTGSRPKISLDNLTVTGIASAPCVAPTSTPTSLTFGNITETTIQGSFLAASPAVNEYLVIMSTGGSLTSLPIDGQTYTIGDNVGDGTVIAKGSDLSFTATGLTGATTYNFFIFPVNSVCTGGPLYLTSNPLTDDATTVAGLPACAAPATQPTSLITVSSINSVQGSFTGTAADGYLILQSSSAVLSNTPVNGVSYSIGATLGNATVIQNGNATAFTASSLSPATQYYYFIFPYNSQACVNGPVYNIVSPLSVPATTSPLPVCATPASQPYSIGFNASNNSVTATFNGSGANNNYLVIMSTSPVLSGGPVDNTDYNVGTALGGGTVISNATSTSFIANNLSTSTTYYFFVFAANKNCTGGTKYLTVAPLTGNATTTNAPVNNIYFGNLHAHSDYSDGNKDHPGFTPGDDYNYALGSLGMDFLGISEHNHFSSLDNPGNELANYHLGVAQAAAFNATHTNFLALYGMEWGVISGGGHVVVYGDGLTDLFGWESNVNGHVGPNYDVYVPKSTYLGTEGLFKTVNDYVAKNAFATLAHPNNTDFNNLSNIAYDAAADSAISGVAVESGPATSTNTSYSNPASPMFYLWYYQKLLSKGYHLGPTIDHDNHNTTFGRTTNARTAVIAPSLTQSDIIKAVKDMHFYATEDRDARVDFTINTRIMGSVFEDRNAPSISVTLTDPTTNTSNALIRVMAGIPGSNVTPVVIDSVFGSSLSYVDNSLANHATGYYYIDITNGTSRIVTSPIWYTRTCASSSELSVTACDNYTWAGTVYTTSTTATKVFTTTGGCDSTVTLHININKSPVSATISTVGSDTGCPGAGVPLSATVADGGNGSISSYQWFKDGNAVATTTVPNYTALITGSYSVKATNINTCSVVSANSVSATVADNLAPVPDVTILPLISGECSVTVTTVPTATDDCKGSVTAQTTDPLSYTQQGSFTITWTFNDGNGNISSQTQTVVVKDVTAPVLSGVPVNTSVSCDNIPAAAIVTAADNCDVSISVVFTEVSTQDVNISSVAHYNYTITRTWTATDAAGNSNTATQIIAVNDTQAPVITVPTNISVSNDAGACSAVVNYTATAADNCSPVTITYSQNAGTSFAVGTTTVHVTATDISGNTSSADFTVTVNDTEKPTITAPGNYSVVNDAGQCSATIADIGSPVVNDNCEVASVTNDHPSPIFLVGTTIVTWTVTDIHGNVTDTAKQTITVIDNELPVITVNNVTVGNDAGICGANIILATPPTSDNCGVASVTNDHPSASFPVGVTNVTWTVTDNNGWTNTAVQTVTVNDTEKPFVITQPVSVYLNASGAATVTASQINNGSTDNCVISSYNLSKTTFTCADLGANTVTLTVTDASGNSNTASAIVTVLDNIAPIVTTQPVTVYLNASATATVTASQINNGSTDNCGISSYSLSKTSFSCADLGANTVTLTVTDASGNSNSASAVVTVLDNTAPAVITQPVTVYLNASGTATVTASQINNGSTDNCVISSYNLSKTTFTCADLGANTVTLTVTDASGNSNTASAIVTVLDNIAPIVTTQPVTVYLNASGTATVTASQINNGSTDNCGISSYSLSKTTFTCANLGANTVTLTVTDASGNSNTASAIVTVLDNIAPIVTTQPVSVYLNASGAATVTASQVNNGSTDNCGISSYSLSKTTFTCANLGANTVTLTVTDASGNSNTASAVVTVLDNIAPTVATQPVTVYLNASGTATVTASQVNNGSLDNCGISSYSLSKTTFTCANLGANTVTLTVVDASGNSNTASAIVTVLDNILPTVVTQSVTVYLNASGTATVTASQVNNGSTDNCGISSYSLSKTSFNCTNLGANTVVLTVYDASGNSKTGSAVVTVKDTTAPLITVVPDQAFCSGTSGTYTIPVLTASDNCSVSTITYSITGATVRSGSGNNASGLFNTGLSVIKWIVTDGSGNQRISTTNVTVNTMPALTIAVSNADAYCNKITLTASSAGTGAVYQWTSGSSVFATTQQISLGQSNGDGMYSVTASLNGCTTTAATYNFQKQFLVSSYTILATKQIDLGENNIVASGSVGVTSANGDIDFSRNSSVSSPGSFVKARSIDRNGSNIVISNPIYAAATGIVLPTMYLNTANTNSLPNRDVAVNSTSTVSGNYKNLTLKKGSNTILTGNTFGTIRVELGARVSFTATTINIATLQVVKGPRNGYSYVRFAPDTKVLVSGSVSIGSQVYINPDNYKVTFYMGDNKSDDEKFTVKGGDTRVSANIYMPNGKLRVTGGYRYGDYGNGFGDTDRDDDEDRYFGQGNSYVYMTGSFITEELTGDGRNVIWNSFDCGAAPVTLINSNTSVNQSIIGTEKTVATSEEELKVTVMPNPSTTFFTLKIESRYTTPVELRVMDGRGRVIDAKSKLGSNSTIQIGNNYSSGTYYAELIQGTQRKVVQLVKINN